MQGFLGRQGGARMSDQKHFGLRIDAGLMERFRAVCEYEGRSANSQILYMIRSCVDDFEKEHGNGGKRDLNMPKKTDK
jgi:hypothetical protein